MAKKKTSKPPRVYKSPRLSASIDQEDLEALEFVKKRTGPYLETLKNEKHRGSAVVRAALRIGLPFLAANPARVTRLGKPKITGDEVFVPEIEVDQDVDAELVKWFSNFLAKRRKKS